MPAAGEAEEVTAAVAVAAAVQSCRVPQAQVARHPSAVAAAAAVQSCPEPRAEAAQQSGAVAAVATVLSFRGAAVEAQLFVVGLISVAAPTCGYGPAVIFGNAGEAIAGSIATVTVDHV